MDGRDRGREIAPSPAGATATRRRIPSRREAVVVALEAALFAAFAVTYFLFGSPLGISSMAGIMAFVLLFVLFGIARAGTRSVHPRHFRLAQGAAGVWAGVGVGVTGMMLGIPDGHEVSMGAALVAALVLSAPLFGCAVWLAVRGR